MAQKLKYLPKVDVNNKVFCMAPFVHMYITPSDREEKICCQAQPHSLFKANFDLESRWTGSKIQSIRQQMTDNFEVATGEIAHLCSRCIEQEKRGDKSDRIMFKESYDYVKPDIIKGNSFGSPLDLDLRPSNLCNLQCRMCISNFSSQIQKEISKSNDLIDFMGPVEIDVADWFTDENINFLLKSLHKGEWTRIKFLGGEPTIMPEVHHILDLLIEQKLTHVQIAITTNLTNVNKEFLNKLEKFEEISVHYSIDGIGKTVEYIRYPVSWNSIQTNIEKWQNIKPDFSSINVTLQAYNLHNLKDLIAWADSIGVEYLINMVWSEWDHIYVLPYEYRKKYLEDINLNITNDILQNTKQDSIIKFVKHTKILDKSRNQHIKNYIPELWEVIGKDYLALQI